MFPMDDSPDSGYGGLSDMIDELNSMADHQFETEDEQVDVKKKLVAHECHYCGLDITDRHLLKVGADQFWHLQCLQCSQCQTGLDDFRTCFHRDQNIYCGKCYISEFSTCCSACHLPIAAGDWIHRAKDYIYHLDCFACDQCKTNLSTGESFSMIGHRLRCKDHMIKREPIVVKQEPISEAPKVKDEEASSTTSSEDNSRSDDGSPKRKRLRTSFTERQLDILRTSFDLDRNPDSYRLQGIADMAGLTKKVVQVWYQNSRQRQKRKDGAVNVKVANRRRDFGMAQILNGSNTVSPQQYYQQIPLVFNFS